MPFCTGWSSVIWCTRLSPHDGSSIINFENIHYNVNVFDRKHFRLQRLLTSLHEKVLLMNHPETAAHTQTLGAGTRGPADAALLYSATKVLPEAVSGEATDAEEAAEAACLGAETPPKRSRYHYFDCVSKKAPNYEQYEETAVDDRLHGVHARSNLPGPPGAAGGSKRRRGQHRSIPPVPPASEPESVCSGPRRMSARLSQLHTAGQDRGRRAGQDPEAESEAEHCRSEQSGHLDGIINGLFLLMNLMAGHAWVGVYLHSGSYLRALKELALTDFWRFKEEFELYPAVDHSGKSAPGGGTMRDAMKGTNNQAKLRAAWNAYVAVKLPKEDQVPWKRVYVKIPEATLLLGSMCTYHFGARFPLIFSKKAVPDDLWHMRLHMYFGSKLFRCPSANPSSGISKNLAQESTIDIFSHEEQYDWLSPAQAWAIAADAAVAAVAACGV